MTRFQLIVCLLSHLATGSDSDHSFQHSESTGNDTDRCQCYHCPRISTRNLRLGNSRWMRLDRDPRPSVCRECQDTGLRGRPSYQSMEDIMASPWPSYAESGRPDDARLDALSGRSSLGVEVLSIQESPQVVAARHWRLTRTTLKLGRTFRDRMKRNLVWCHRCPGRDIADCSRFCDSVRDIEDQDRVYDEILRERNAQLVACNEARTVILHEADADLGELGTASSTAASSNQSSSTPQRVRHLVIQTIVNQADQRTTRVTERAARSDRIDTQVQSIEDVMNNLRDSARVAWAARTLHGGDSDGGSGTGDIPASSVGGGAAVSSQSQYIPTGAVSASMSPLALDTRGMGSQELRELVALANPFEATADERDRISHVDSDQSSETEDLRSDTPGEASERP